MRIGNPVTSSTVTWTSNDAQIADAEFDWKETANVTTSKAGMATITASVGGVKGTATITVNPGAVASVDRHGAIEEPEAWDPRCSSPPPRLDSQGNAVPNQSFFWSSSNPIVASVSSSGVVTGKRNGNVTITAYSTLIGWQERIRTRST